MKYIEMYVSDGNKTKLIDIIYKQKDGKLQSQNDPNGDYIKDMRKKKINSFRRVQLRGNAYCFFSAIKDGKMPKTYKTKKGVIKL